MALGTNAMRRQGGKPRHGKVGENDPDIVLDGFFWGGGIRGPELQKGLKDEFCPHLEVDGWFFLKSSMFFDVFSLKKKTVYQRCTVSSI